MWGIFNLPDKESRPDISRQEFITMRRACLGSHVQGESRADNPEAGAVADGSAESAAASVPVSTINIRVAIAAVSNPGARRIAAPTAAAYYAAMG
jgi:hypothetical protein